MPRQSLLAANIRENQVGRLLETERLHWRLDGEARHYHSLTRGWVANEVFRRLHPDGLTMGEFLRQEVSSRLGADIYLGLEETEQCRVFDVEMSSWVRPLLLTNWLPRSLGRRDDLGVADLARCVGRELWNSRAEWSTGGQRGGWRIMMLICQLSYVMKTQLKALKASWAFLAFRCVFMA